MVDGGIGDSDPVARSTAAIGVVKRRWLPATNSGAQSHQRTFSSRSQVRSSKRRRIGWAGLPTTISYGRTSRRTTAPAPITAPSPMVTGPTTTAVLPIQTSLPTCSGRVTIGPPDGGSS